jgi:NhaP-type Na+/H+ or K+/H+ antiporter
MNVSFAQALLIIGLILVVTSALSGWLRGNVLSISVLSVLAGIGLSATDVISVAPGSLVVVYAVELALVLTLFSDGLLVERELFESVWSPPIRALLIAMPLTFGLISGAAMLLFPTLSLQEAFLLGAVLSPTDPVVTSVVVTARRVPAIIRHTLNLESGLNDGLAFPAVLFFLALAVGEGGAAYEAGSLTLKVIVGGLIGVGLAFVGGWLLDRLPGGGLVRRYEGIYALGLGFAAFGIADETYGNGIIAAFVAGIALAVARHEIPTAFGHFNEALSAVFQVITFVVFGALIVATGWSGNTIALVAFILLALLVARPLAVLVSYIGVGMPMSFRIFIAWFGPKGVASMLFALLVLNSTDLHRSLVFDIASFTVLASIMTHGLTDTLGADWIERRLSGQRPVMEEENDEMERLEPK